VYNYYIKRSEIKLQMYIKLKCDKFDFIIFRIMNEEFRDCNQIYKHSLSTSSYSDIVKILKLMFRLYLTLYMQISYIFY